MRLFNRVCNTIIQVYTYLGVVLLCVIVIACSTQVFTRYILQDAISGSEEISRYCFIWLGFVGSAVCAQRWSNAWISIVHDLTKGRAKKWHGIILNVMVLICAVILLIQGIKCVGVTSRQLSSMLKIPMCYVYAAIPVGAFGIIVRTMQRLVNSLAGNEMEVGA